MKSDRHRPQEQC